MGDESCKDIKEFISMHAVMALEDILLKSNELKDLDEIIRA